MDTTTLRKVTTRGTRKTSTATADCIEQINDSNSDFTLTIDNKPLSVFTDSFLVTKITEIIKLIGEENLENLNIKIKTAGGGSVSKVTAVRLALCKAIVAFYGKFYDESKKQEIKAKLLNFDKYTLISDIRKREAKKVGGPGARAKYTKSYR
ncbi:40S ribosomal protein S16 [Cucumispora dikerogammari]|nr:40S ribosomal protein S16 [Cucumispora dikerogammari]